MTTANAELDALLWGFLTDSPAETEPVSGLDATSVSFDVGGDSRVLYLRGNPSTGPSTSELSTSVAVCSYAVLPGEQADASFGPDPLMRRSALAAFTVLFPRSPSWGDVALNACLDSLESAVRSRRSDFESRTGGRVRYRRARRTPVPPAEGDPFVQTAVDFTFDLTEALGG